MHASHRRAAVAAILPSLTAFCRALKDANLDIGLSQVIDAARSLEFIDVSEKHDFRVALRSNLVSRREDLAPFDRAFEAFWSQPQGAGARPPASEDRTRPDRRHPAAAEPGGGPDEPHVPAPAIEQDRAADPERYLFPVCAADEAVVDKDFGTLAADESRAVERLIRRLAPQLATAMSRRRERALRPHEIDPRRTLRRSLEHGGELIELAFRKRRVSSTRIVLICDVSGSMDCYSRFLIQFMYGLQNDVRGVETFVFSTFLTRITELIRTGDVARALERLSLSMLGWSGGTHIGGSLRTFNDRFAPRLVTSRTLVVIISDGWERGDSAMLSEQMRALRRRCRRILWLNPLCSRRMPMREFCSGLQAALPHVDLLLPAGNLRSLLDVGGTLLRLGV